MNLDNWRLADQWRAINKAKSTGEIKQALADRSSASRGSTRPPPTRTATRSTATSAPRPTCRARSSRCARPTSPSPCVFSLSGPAGPRRFALRPASGMRTPRRAAARACCPATGCPSSSGATSCRTRTTATGSPTRRWTSTAGTSRPPWASFPGQQNMRTRIGITQAQARLAGTDGLAGNKFTLREPAADRALEPQLHRRPVHGGRGGPLRAAGGLRRAGRVRRALGVGPQVRPHEPRRAPLPRVLQHRAQHPERVPGAVQLPRPGQHAARLRRSRTRPSPPRSSAR